MEGFVREAEEEKVSVIQTGSDETVDKDGGSVGASQNFLKPTTRTNEYVKCSLALKEPSKPSPWGKGLTHTNPIWAHCGAPMNSSSKYDHITCKVLIQSGTPTLYRLILQKENYQPQRTIKENTGTLTRMTLGEKNPNKMNKTILLVGETGTGKSTLVNALVNYAMGVEWEDDVWFQIVEDEKRSQSESQTSDVIVYQIFGFEDKTLPYSLTIIDTPGYGDTRGIERDASVSQRLLDLFQSEDGVHEINAVGLVMKASVNRLSDRLRYIFDSVMSLFGKDIEKNIVALITHSDGQIPENVLKALEAANIKCAEDEENEPVCFMFNNRQSTQKTKKNKVALKSAWDITMDQISNFTDFLKENSPQKLETTVEESKIHTRLTACIQNQEERIRFIDLKQAEIQQTMEGLKKHEQEREKNEEFTVEVDEVYKDKEPIRGGQWGLFYEGAVCCKTCDENCHYPGCTVAWRPEDCEVMKDDRCTSCTGKCPVSDHVKEEWKYVNKTRKVKKTLNDMKEKYEKNKAGSQSKLSLLETFQQKIEELQKEKDQLLEKSFEHVVQLDQITLKVDSISTRVDLDYLIENMLKRDAEKFKKLKEIKSRLDERTRAASRNTSSKYWNIISTSDVIQSGFPTLYQLTPKKKDIKPPRTKTNNIGTLTRMTLGEKDPNKMNKTILLVGETGAGKSTLINALVNYAMGVKWEDDVWFQIVEDEKRSQSESQTSDVIVYQIFGFEDKTLPYSLTIIDTPGYGSTDGIKHDAIIGQRLFDLFRSADGVHEINAVGLVLKASVNRLTDHQRYIFDSVISLFGKDIEKNIVALITHSNGVTPENVLQALKDANIKCARDKKNLPVYFMMDNCQSKEKKMRDTVALRHAWDVTKDQIDQFTEFLKETLPQNLITTVEVLDTNIRLTACINNLQERIKSIDLKQEEIKQTQQLLKKHEEEMKNNENFTIEVDAVYRDKEPVDERRWWGLWLNHGGAVCCTVCEENCHHPCTLAWYPKHCEVIKDGRCTSCTRKCPVSDHVKENWIYVDKKRKVLNTEKDMKKKYEKGKTEGEKKTSLLETLKKNTEELEKEKDQWLEESFQHLANLEQIALNVNSVSTYVHLDVLIEKMDERGDTEKKKKLEEMKNKMDKDKGIKAVMRYRLGQLAAAVKTKK
ncbi:uncharacterized protein LOC116067089 [Sander lucioperca]|uniref:uncharacterized protein LOC116067089 n=1 Tax=Sander lucioperca TaxID=283035 RepID=UPI0016539F62|nr:uncharacterized protein LOC116067089 [Sander lucioperca]